MTLATDLAAVLKPDKLVVAAHGGDIVLSDRRAGMRVQVVGTPAATAVIRLERIGHSAGLRDGPWKRICDYLLVVDWEGGLHAVFVELKRTSTGELRPRDQLRRSLPLLEYLRSVCEVEGCDASIGSISTRYFIICEKRGRRLDKQSVKVDPARRIREERHEGVTIRTFIGTRVPFTTLLGA